MQGPAPSVGSRPAGRGALETSRSTQSRAGTGPDRGSNFCGILLPPPPRQASGWNRCGDVHFVGNRPAGSHRPFDLTSEESYHPSQRICSSDMKDKGRKTGGHGKAAEARRMAFERRRLPERAASCGRQASSRIFLLYLSSDGDVQTPAFDGGGGNNQPLHGRKWSCSGPELRGRREPGEQWEVLGQSGTGAFPASPPPLGTANFGEERPTLATRPSLISTPGAPILSSRTSETCALWGQLVVRVSHVAPAASGWSHQIFGPGSPGFGQDCDLEVSSQREKGWPRPCACQMAAGTASFRRPRSRPQWACRG